jgi:hypothetical protein
MREKLIIRIKKGNPFRSGGPNPRIASGLSPAVPVLSNQSDPTIITSQGRYQRRRFIC